MKTTLIHTAKSIVNNGLCRTWRVLALFLLVNCQLSIVNSVSAQEAFYVYRNDGDFNGFFYDQIVRMEYSKVDLDGNVQEKYVVQEIETLDSLYRIPLAAIDSIGFQQPEIILNPNLKNIEEMGLHPYVISVNEGNWQTGKRRKVLLIRDNAPKEVIPKVGDVIVDWGEDYEGYEPGYWGMKSGNFSGKVAEIKHDTSNPYIHIICDSLKELSDVFVQFISTEQITADKAGNIKHRLAGWKEGPKKAYEDQGSQTFIDFEGTVKRTYSPKDGVDIALQCDVELLAKMQVSYYISWKRLYVKTDLTTHAAAKPALSIQSSTSFEGYIDVMEALNKIKFPVNLPIFQTRPIPNLDVKASGSANLQLTFPKKSFDWNPTIIFDTNAGQMMRYTSKEDDPEDKKEDSPIDTGDLELSLNGSLQVGIEFSANIETNDWIEDIFSSGIELSTMVGPKIEGSLNLSTAGLASDGAYVMLKDSYIKFHPLSVDLEAKAKLKFLWKDPENTTFLEKSKQWGTVDWYLFPDFSETKAEYDKGKRQIDFYTKAKRKTFLPNYVTVGLYNYNDSLLEDYKHNFSIFLTTDSLEVEKSFDVKKAGQYMLKYGTSCVGFDINAGTKWISVPPYIQHGSEEKDSIEVTGAAQKKQELITTNVTKLDNLGSRIIDHYDAHDNYYNGGFVEASYSNLEPDDESAWLNLNIKENSSLLSRYADVVVSTYISGAGSDRDTLRVRQQPLYSTINKAKIRYAGYFRYGYPEWSNYEQAVVTEYASRDIIYASRAFPVSCSRSGDVFTISGTYSHSDHEYKLNIVVDVTDKKNAVFSGRAEDTYNGYYTITTTFEGHARPSFYPVDEMNEQYYGNLEGVHGSLQIRPSSTDCKITSCDVKITKEEWTLDSVTPPSNLDIYLLY